MRLSLLGYPLSHSVSPAMHNAALAELGLNGWRYVPAPVPPEGLAQAVAGLRGDEHAGANVTVPHKQAVVALIDGVTPVAHAIGAVNTLVKKDGRLLGHNTDAAGLLADLYALDVHVSKRPVLILGAGGSARAAIAALAGVGARLRVVARRPEQVESLRSISALEAFPWTPLGLLTASDDVALIVNTTPLGMTPNTDASPWLEGTPFPPDAFVYDLVYNPADTLFVRQARADGLRAATGLGMLVEQGALALELWTGQTAPRATMRRAAEANLYQPVRGLN
jgi:shikimate dehydrogenase